MLDNVVAASPAAHKVVVFNTAVGLSVAILDMANHATDVGEIGLIVSRKATAAPVDG